MDIKFLTLPPWELARINMRLSIEPKTDNTGKEEKGRMSKYRRGKIKGSKNYMRQTTTLSLIIIKR
jgi:hypothetical protein